MVQELCAYACIVVYGVIMRAWCSVVVASRLLHPCELKGVNAPGVVVVVCWCMARGGGCRLRERGCGGVLSLKGCKGVWRSGGVWRGVEGCERVHSGEEGY